MQIEIGLDNRKDNALESYRKATYAAIYTNMHQGSHAL